MSDTDDTKRLTIISSQGSLDWAYPPFILASTAASMGMESTIFFTFYGLLLLKKDLSSLKVSPHANPAMPMKMPFGPEGFQNVEWPIPNFLMGGMPFFDHLATALMKKTFANNNVMSIEDMRALCLDVDVRLIACQMTMDVFGFTTDDFIDGVEIAGAAAYLELAGNSDINLFV